MKNVYKALISLTAAVGLITLTAASAFADVNASGQQDGIGVNARELKALASGKISQSGQGAAKTYEYTSVYACQFNIPGDKTADVMCMGALQGCAGNTPEQGQGPLVRLYRRELSSSGTPISGWASIGTTCFPSLVPGKPVLGLGQILAAFHNTPWAKPTAHIQPEGNVTLVTLATYFEVNWPTAGFQPGEIDTVTLLGTPVRIRPTGQGYTYVFGDGTSLGPTASPGGPYPGGDITHAYPKAGTYNTHIDITYGGEFSIAGGAWVPIPDSVTVAGSLQPLTVKTARARLVTR
ncbi:MAG: hypothetical protein ACYDDU_07395 [Dermatophilaceae bacterium]